MVHCWACTFTSLPRLLAQIIFRPSGSLYPSLSCWLVTVTPSTWIGLSRGKPLVSWTWLEVTYSWWGRMDHQPVETTSLRSRKEETSRPRVGTTHIKQRMPSTRFTSHLLVFLRPEPTAVSFPDAAALAIRNPPES